MSWYEKREHLGWVLLNNKITKPLVECGVWYGGHLDELKSIWKGECIGVDTYRQHPDYLDANNLTPEPKYEEIYQQVSKRHRIIREDSVSAAAHFKDASLGCVYLDANHSYLHLTKELEVWWPKVAQGGILCGHDFQVGIARDRKTWFGVARAVADFTIKNNLACLHTSDKQDWYVFKDEYYKPEEILVVSNFFGDWPEEVKANHQQYCSNMGYDYIGYDLPPPDGMDPQWSKIVCLLQAMKDHPDKKMVWWVDGDIVFMNNYPIHHWAFKRYKVVGGAYKIPGYETGALNTAWFGMQNTEEMKGVLQASFGYQDLARAYPHEEGALTRILHPRANCDVLLEDVHHVAPCTFWGHFSSEYWMSHVIGQHTKLRRGILRDCCAMSNIKYNIHPTEGRYLL